MDNLPTASADMQTTSADPQTVNQNHRATSSDPQTAIQNQYITLSNSQSATENQQPVSADHQTELEHFELLDGFDYQSDVLNLFNEYTQFLADITPGFEIYLQIQNYDQEILDLHIKYGRPAGRLYLARVNGKPAGCIGLKSIFDHDCEMKRLYVKEKYRNSGIGQILIDRILQDAINIGYESMYLDSLPSLQAALHLYERNGFEYIGPYNESPADKTIFMKKKLINR